MTFSELKNRLIFYCQRDNIAPPDDEAGRVINAGNKKLTRKGGWGYAELTAIPAAVSGYPLKRVPVSLSRKIISLKSVWYPNTDRSNERRPGVSQIMDGTLYLVNLDTDGTSSITVAGWFEAPDLVSATDEPIIPSEFHEQIVQAAFMEWAASVDLSPSAHSRIRTYEALFEKAVTELRTMNLSSYYQKADYFPTPTWTNITVE